MSNGNDMTITIWLFDYNILVYITINCEYAKHI